MDDRGKTGTATGRCLCGGVRYEVRGPMRPALECHCPTCRRFTGGLWNATAARRGDTAIHDAGSLRWYPSSPHARRGFCGTCGSGLFFDREDLPYLAITAGTLDEPTGLRLSARIWMQYRADYNPPGHAVPSVSDGEHGLADPAAWARGRVTGSCLCQGVRYAIAGPLRPVVECHCRTCRRFTGGLWNATAGRRADVAVEDSGTLSWYRSSAVARRGFCGACGSSLFMDREDRPYLVATAGTLDEPTGLRLAVRIFTSNAGDYYRFGEGVPAFEDNRHGLEIPAS